MIELISQSDDPVVYELIEDGMFEYYIKEPVKMFSRMVMVSFDLIKKEN